MLWQVKTYLLHGLPLGLVDGHVKGWSNRKLAAFEMERQVIIRGTELYARYEDALSSMAASNDLCINDIS